MELSYNVIRCMLLLWVAGIASGNRMTSIFHMDFLSHEAEKKNQSEGVAQRSLNLKAVYINTDTAVERRQHIEKMFKDVGLVAHRIAAFDYKKLTNSNVVNILGYPKSALKMNENIVAKAGGEEAIGMHIQDGTTACYMSHVAAVRKLNETMLPGELGLVMEDDVQLRKDWAKRLRHLLKIVPDDWCVLKVNGWGLDHVRAADHVYHEERQPCCTNISTNATNMSIGLNHTSTGVQAPNSTSLAGGFSWDIYRTSGPFKEFNGGGEQIFYASAAGYMVRKDKMPDLLNQLMQPNITDFDEQLLSTKSCVAYEALPYIVELVPTDSHDSTFHSEPWFFKYWSKFSPAARTLMGPVLGLFSKFL